jgi:uncharacterized membrane protein YbhN (UPF0104 family)
VAALFFSTAGRSHRRIGKVVATLIATSAFVACAWYLAQKFLWADAFAYLLRTDFVRLIALVCAAHFAYILLRTRRWQIVVRHANPEIGFAELYWITAIVVSLANITPGQLGEALKIELLKRRGRLGRLPGLGAFALERILDVMVIAAMASIGLVFGSGLSSRYPGLATAVALLFACGVAALYVLLRFNPGGRASALLGKVRSGSGSPRIWIRMFGLSVLSWVFVGVGWQVSLQAVDIHLSLTQILWLISLVTLGTLLSFVPGGLGVAEVLAFGALSSIGVAPIPAQAGAMILRIYGLIIIVFGLLHLAAWLLYRRVRSKVTGELERG